MPLNVVNAGWQQSDKTFALHSLVAFYTGYHHACGV